MTVLVDTSVLLAFTFARDSNHPRAAALMQSLRGEERIIAAPVPTELFYVTLVRVGYSHAVQAFARTHTAFRVEGLTERDMDRMQEIMADYQDAQFDFTDVAIMALAERYGITRVCTLDRRDFSIFRPAHCDYLTLLP